MAPTMDLFSRPPCHSSWSGWTTGWCSGKWSSESLSIANLLLSGIKCCSCKSFFCLYARLNFILLPSDGRKLQSGYCVQFTKSQRGYLCDVREVDKYKKKHDILKKVINFESVKSQQQQRQQRFLSHLKQKAVRLSWHMPVTTRTLINTGDYEFKSGVRAPQRRLHWIASYLMGVCNVSTHSVFNGIKWFH